MRIGVQLNLGFAAVIALLAVLAGIGVNRMAAVIGNTDLILNDRYAKVALAHIIESDVSEQARALQTALITTDIELVRGEMAKVEEADHRILSAVEKLQQMDHLPGGRDALARMVKSRQVYSLHKAQLIKFVVAQSLDEGSVYLIESMLPAQNDYLSAIKKFNRTQTEEMTKFGEESTRMAKEARVLIIGLAVAAASLGVSIAFFMTRSITMPISQAVAVAKTVALGDLTSQIDVRRSDETGQLLLALQQMNNGLTEIVGQVRESSESVATGASQIASGNFELSRRTEDQASSLQNTAAAVALVTAMSKQSADVAATAVTLAEEARLAAMKGGEAIREVAATMTEIAASARKISEITGVIDAIALQTNILALNAAVEGARAADHGRGFSVVADEVRTLAQRAASAAKDIKALTNDSVERTIAGARLVDGTGRTMEEIVNHVVRVAQLIVDINVATQEQDVSFRQVSDAVTELDRATQQNAALVEQSSAAADSLSHQSTKLANIVYSFKLAS